MEGGGNEGGREAGWQESSFHPKARKVCEPKMVLLLYNEISTFRISGTVRSRIVNTRVTRKVEYHRYCPFSGRVVPHDYMELYVLLER